MFSFTTNNNKEINENITTSQKKETVVEFKISFFLSKKRKKKLFQRIHIK